MNVQNILAVADAIEQHTIPWLGFNMNTFMYDAACHPDLSGHNCGTSACIAGWTIAVANNAASKADMVGSFAAAQEWLGIPDNQRRELFYASNHPDAEYDTGPLETLTPDQAIRTLRHLAAIGEVDWTV